MRNRSYHVTFHSLLYFIMELFASLSDQVLFTLLSHLSAASTRAGPIDHLAFSTINVSKVIVKDKKAGINCLSVVQMKEKIG